MCWYLSHEEHFTYSPILVLHHRINLKKISLKNINEHWCAEGRITGTGNTPEVEQSVGRLHAIFNFQTLLLMMKEPEKNPLKEDILFNNLLSEEKSFTK